MICFGEYISSEFFDYREYIDDFRYSCYDCHFNHCCNICYYDEHKKYELTEKYRCEIFSWYKSVVETMIKIIHYCESGEFYREEFSNERTLLLSALSTFTEIRRFYFPNDINSDGFGKHKPAAYHGHRHDIIEPLMRFYSVASKKANNKTINLLWECERCFTSSMFSMINPRKRNNEYSKYISITIPERQTSDNYLDKIQTK